MNWKINRLHIICQDGETDSDAWTKRKRKIQQKAKEEENEPTSQFKSCIVYVHKELALHQTSSEQSLGPRLTSALHSVVGSNPQFLQDTFADLHHRYAT